MTSPNNVFAGGYVRSRPRPLDKTIKNKYSWTSANGHLLQAGTNLRSQQYLYYIAAFLPSISRHQPAVPAVSLLYRCIFTFHKQTPNCGPSSIFTISLHFYLPLADTKLRSLQYLYYIATFLPSISRHQTAVPAVSLLYRYIFTFHKQTPTCGPCSIFTISLHFYLP